MKALFLSSAVLVFGATASFAGSFELTESQMDGVTAGALIEVTDSLNNLSVGVAVPVNVSAAANVCALAGRCVQDAETGQQIIRVPGQNRR